jgi:hypothetical protein
MAASATPKKKWKPKKQPPKYLRCHWYDEPEFEGLTMHRVEDTLIERMLDILTLDGPLPLATLQEDLSVIPTEDERKVAKKSWQYIPGILYLITRARADGIKVLLDKTGKVCYNGWRTESEDDNR